jgi:uncharacterized membrane protein YfcA
MLIVNPLNSSEVVFPILECVHIIGLTVSVGTIAMVDLRVLDIAMRHQTAAQLDHDTFTWTLTGLIVMIFSGLLLFSSDPDMYYLNWSFLIKMACLALAIIFHYTIRRKTLASPKSSPNAKVVALASLVLWAGVIFGGIFIGFVNEGLKVNWRL